MAGSIVPIAGPVSALSSTTKWITPQELATFNTLEDFPEKLAAKDTVIVYIDWRGEVFHLNGPMAGAEGVRIGEQLQGEHHLPFEQVLVEGAFQIGATIQRTNILKRLINTRITIGREGMKTMTYRTCEAHWWAGQVETKPGWLGVFTRLSGWRWVQVWPYKTVDTTIKQDPVAYGNNFCVWDIYWIAPVPYYSKPAAWEQVRMGDLGVPDKDGMYHGNVVLGNSGDMESHVEYVVTGGGYCQVQDNNSGRMVELPRIFDSDGSVLVRTDSAFKTLTSTNEPDDTLYYQRARASGILNFFLSGVADAGVPIWRRKYTRFLYDVQPNSVCHFTIKHSNPNATVNVVLPQRYRRSR